MQIVWHDMQPRKPPLEHLYDNAFHRKIIMYTHCEFMSDIIRTLF